MYNIPVSSWDDPYGRYIISEIDVDTYWTNFSDSYTTFKSGLTLDELANQNNDFLGKIKFYSVLNEYDANLYFHDNNYYVVYFVPESEFREAYYVARNMHSIIESYGEQPRMAVPLPMELTLAPFAMEELTGDGEESYLTYFFDNLTFEDACRFYDKYENGVAEYDKENKLIYVDVREKTRLKTYHEKYLCIDFNNRQFICDKGGDNEYIFE